MCISFKNNILISPPFGAKGGTKNSQRASLAWKSGSGSLPIAMV
jgi:hypothetical protein